jgi:alpha-tubulin suppressor-like RCC1 family protein
VVKRQILSKDLTNLRLKIHKQRRFSLRPCFNLKKILIGGTLFGLSIFGVVGLLGQAEQETKAILATSITPNKGPIAGGTEVTIAGQLLARQELTVKQLSVGGRHSCVIASDDNAYCWGDNGLGQVGNNKEGEGEDTPVAVNVLGVLSGKTIKQISAGYNHTCAIASDDQVYCWGMNSSGQLGNGENRLSQTVPVAVDTSGVLLGKTIKQVSTGYGHTCAIASDNKAYCWGNGGVGALGNDNDDDGVIHSSNVPVAVYASGVLSGKTIKQISAGYYHSCVIASDDKAYCWGDDTLGQLGDGSNTEEWTTCTSSYFNLETKYLCSTIPVAVNASGALSGKTVKYISTGDNLTCAIASDDKAYCWGSDQYGQLGNGPDATNMTTCTSVSDVVISCALSPVTVNVSGVLSGKTVKQISAGDNHVCVVASDNGAYCWGRNDDGQLGNNSLVDSVIPATVNASGVLSGKTIKQIGASRYIREHSSSCVLASDNKVYCWGSNSNSQLAVATPSSSSVPVGPASFPRPFFVTLDIGGASASCRDVSTGDSNITTNFAPDGTWVKCKTSVHSAGQVSVTVNNGVDAPVAMASSFAYEATTLPIVTSISPDRGPTTGGTQVTITGSNFSIASGADSFDQCGSYQPWTASSSGDYKFEVWGAQGGTGTSGVLDSYAKGGYATGQVYLTAGTQLYVYVGCAGNSTGVGGWNGGGDGFSGESGSGGGATDIRFVPDLPGDFMSFVNSVHSRLIVAGGGGGQGEGSGTAGYGGGTTGGSGSNSTDSGGGQDRGGDAGGATKQGVYSGGHGGYGTGGNAQSTNCYFGPCTSDDRKGGGGGGGWFGGGAGFTGSVASSGGGGSGYVFIPSAFVDGQPGMGSVPSASYYLANTSLVNGNNTMKNPYSSGDMRGKTGDGYARITKVGDTVQDLGAVSATIGGVNCSSFTVVSSTEITCRTGVNTAGVVNVAVGSSSGAGTGAGLFTYYDWSNPSAKTISPTTGPTTGGMTVTITGTSLDAVNSVKIDGKDCTSINIINETRITCVTPSNTAGRKNVVVGTPYGTSSTLYYSYEYILPPIPNYGFETGGTEVVIPGLAGMHQWVQVGVGDGFACGLVGYGQVYCWGDNTYGQLGNGTYDSSLTPVLVDTSNLDEFASFKMITVGRDHVCGIDDILGKPYCWGNNEWAQLGNSAGLDSPIPRGLDSTSFFLRMVSAGDGYTCGIAGNSKAYCWGNGASGQLGDGGYGYGYSMYYPMEVSGGMTFSGIAAGTNHTCAWQGNTDGVYCWGDNTYGQLGNETSGNYSTTPVAVSTSQSYFDGYAGQVSVGLTHTCAVGYNDYTAYCWGNNDDGQLGDPHSYGYGEGWGYNVDYPIDVFGLSHGIVAIAAGQSSTCAVDGSGYVDCWGDNAYGQLGDGSNDGSQYPVQVPDTYTDTPIFPYSSYSPGDMFSAGFADSFCGVGVDFVLYCWGSGVGGQLGNSLTSDVNEPVEAALVWSVAMTNEFGSSPCNITSSSADVVNCTTTAHEPGLADIVVSDGTSTMTFPATCSSLDPNACNGIRDLGEPPGNDRANVLFGFLYEEIYVSLNLDSSSVKIGGAGVSPAVGVGSGTSGLTVATNNPIGYNVKLSTNQPSSAHASDMVHQSLSGKYLLATANTCSWNGTAFNNTNAVLSPNSYGFTMTSANLSAQKLCKIPDSSVPLTVKSTAVANEAGDSTTVYYGVKINTQQPAGEYQATVMYTAVVNL